MKKPVLAALLAALTTGGAMAAPLMGSTLRYAYYYPTLAQPYAGTPDSNGTFVVGDGVEIEYMTDGVGWMDISGTQITIGFTRLGRFGDSPQGFNGWVLSDVLGTIDRFSAVALNPATTLAGLTPDRLSFTGDTISLNWQGLDHYAGMTVVLDVTTAVPEPGTLSLMSVALLGIAAVRRRG